LRAVLRPLWLLLVAVTVLLAVVTMTGRVLVAWLPQLEPRVNALLVGRGIEIEGLRGHWHVLNPVVHVERLTFGGGRASDVTVEFDVLESALYSTLIVRHLSAARVELAPVRGSDGRWRLGAGGGGGGFPLADFLHYSDGLRFPDVRVRFADPSRSDGADSLAPIGEVRARVALANAGLRHSGEIVISVDRGGRGVLRLAYNLSDAWLGRPTNGEVVIDGERLAVEPAFGLAVGAGGATIDQLHGHWSFDGARSAGQLALAARGLTMPTGTLDSVDLALRGSTGRFGRRWDLAVDRLGITSAHGAVHLDDTVVAVEMGLSGRGDIDVALPALDAAPVVGVIRDVAANVPGVEEWLGGLNPHGRIDHARMRFDLDDSTLSYVADVSGLGLENWKGIPRVRNGKASVAGTEHSVDIRLDGDQVEVGFLDHFDRPTLFDHLEGSVLIWFTPSYLAVQGRNLSGTFGPSTVQSHFTFGRPSDVLEQRLMLVLRIQDIEARHALNFVPRELPQALHDGLDQAIVAGRVDAAELVYHGHLRTIEGLPMRQAELRVALHDGVVRFHPDWPAARGVAGRIEYTAVGTTGQFGAGDLAGIAISDATVVLPHSMKFVDFQGKGSGDGIALRQLIDTSPLAGWLTFVKPEWVFAGKFDYAADMKIPVEAGVVPELDLHVDLKEFTAQLTDLNLELGALRGKVQYRYPNAIDAELLTGRLFDRPAQFSVRSEDGAVRVGFVGETDAKQILDWRGWPNPGLADGSFAFTGDYAIRPGSSEPATLTVQSDLVGVTLSLPPPLGKLESDPRSTTLGLTFSADHDRLDLRLGDAAQGWLRIVDGRVVGGSVGIGVPAPAERGDEDSVTIEGGLEQLDLTDRLRGGESGFYPAFPWSMNAFRIDRVTFNTLAFEDVVADVLSASGNLRIHVAGPDVEGSMIWAAEAPPHIDLQHLKLPAGKPGDGGDPLGSIDPKSIIDLDVDAQNVSLGGDSFGNWHFDLRRTDEGVAIQDLVAEVRGLDIRSTDDAVWSGANGGGTHFKGRLRAGDLAKVLPQWNYAPSLETTSARVDADIGWPGSPLNFALPRIVGTLSLKAEKGRFVDLGEGSGAVRVFGLLNFAAIAKRMTLDFSDVFGKGISFDKVTGSVMADQGVIRFIDPLRIDGTGGDFRINGTVNLLTGTLDNEMVVTLPVSASLPWYAAYLGFVNPIAAGAVIVGERLFRNQIDKMSSAKYKIGGTLQNPEVNFQQVFPPAMEQPPGGAVETPAQPIPATASASTEAARQEAPSGATEATSQREQPASLQKPSAPVPQESPADAPQASPTNPPGDSSANASTQ
jgi:uncharacterized protein (TIGR02099 family)